MCVCECVMGSMGGYSTGHTAGKCPDEFSAPSLLFLFIFFPHSVFVSLPLVWDVCVKRNLVTHVLQFHFFMCVFVCVSLLCLRPARLPCRPRACLLLLPSSQ